MTALPNDAWTTPQPLDNAKTLPALLYTSAEVHAEEQRRVFARSWQCVAHVQQLAAVGDHVVAEVAGVPLVLVRGEDGELRALHNVCRHRAGPLASCDGRGARALHCQYHGWTYTLSGQLRSAPEMREAADFNISEIRLPQARLEVWRGLVFVAIEQPPPLAEVLEGMDERLGTIDFSAYAHHQRISYSIAANWKTYVDNFLEGYHLPHIHPGLNKLLDYRSYQTETATWHSLQSSPLDRTTNFYGSGEALYYFIFPNTMLNILPGRLQTNRVVPISADHCRVDFDFYYPPCEDSDELERRARDLAFSDEVQVEDIAICERVQRGLASGSYEAGRVSPKRERGVHHFHELIRRVWR
ncbi:MAG: aromatic ring-hydroxylating dioxygenase subunit alpha [Dokdonella sp.]|jgi:choline monooxygenase|uniref:aromatic ring-hydroxylating oxygenase subunit alpha n=1 Tax=Dokdonella sp. TaxID=2291710 RepID=UPI002B799A46|nr:aromatic ring-hydroxylating dioxygenase subunit alpha [Dokdonella sp.]HNV08783.1 aromatic ring-hydroxylating dioxygenase subunit alpha [Dokdonella sp.]HPW04818.1 aromatic ring-hydroxylating dioxygenase subunit alpha [Dokdonella sp.]